MKHTSAQTVQAAAALILVNKIGIRKVGLCTHSTRCRGGDAKDVHSLRHGTHTSLPFPPSRETTNTNTANLFCPASPHAVRTARAPTSSTLNSKHTEAP